MFPLRKVFSFASPIWEMPVSGLPPTFDDITSKAEIMTEVISYFSNLGPHQIIGVVGSVCYIGAFGMVQVGLMDGNSMAYSLVNIVTASLVCISLLAEFNIATALIQGSWIVIGTVGLVLRARKAWPRTRRTLNTTLDVEVQ